MKFPDLLTEEQGELLFILRCRINHCHEMLDMDIAPVTAAYWKQQLVIAELLYDRFSLG